MRIKIGKNAKKILKDNGIENYSRIVNELYSTPMLDELAAGRACESILKKYCPNVLNHYTIILTRLDNGKLDYFLTLRKRKYPPQL